MGEVDSDEEVRTRGEFAFDENGNLSRVPPDPDFGILDICVARVINVARHPKFFYHMYLQTLDTGLYKRKRKAATMITTYYEPCELLGRLVLTALNVRSMFERDLVKRFMLMFAQNRKNGRLELLDPPPGSVEGDTIVVEGFPYDPLHEICLGKYERKATKHYFLPYKKGKDGIHFEEYDGSKYMFDSTASELWVNKEGVAEFMGIPLRVEGKGVVTSRTLRDCPVAFE